jgi:hypothetical protein
MEARIRSHDGVYFVGILQGMHVAQIAPSQIALVRLALHEHPDLWHHCQRRLHKSTRGTRLRPYEYTCGQQADTKKLAGTQPAVEPL